MWHVRVCEHGGPLAAAVRVAIRFKQAQAKPRARAHPTPKKLCPRGPIQIPRFAASVLPTAREAYSKTRVLRIQMAGIALRLGAL